MLSIHRCLLKSNWLLCLSELSPFWTMTFVWVDALLQKWVNSKHTFHVTDFLSVYRMLLTHVPTLPTECLLQPSSRTPHFFKRHWWILGWVLMLRPRKRQLKTPYCWTNQVSLFYSGAGHFVGWLLFKNISLPSLPVCWPSRTATDLLLEARLSGNKHKLSLIFLERAFIAGL
jgi:hypothetical protein